MLLALARLASLAVMLENTNVEREIAWARATWPALANANFRSPVGKLYAWVLTENPIDVTVYTPDHDCMSAKLERKDRGFLADDDHFLPDYLSATVRFPVREPEMWPYEWVEQLEVELGGELVRHQPWDGELGGIQWRRRYGVASYVDARVARFGGEPIRYADLLTSGSADRTSYEHDRVNALLRRKVAWHPLYVPFSVFPAPFSVLPAIYRDGDDCRREHPPAPATPPPPTRQIDRARGAR